MEADIACLLCSTKPRSTFWTLRLGANFSFNLSARFGPSDPTKSDNLFEFAFKYKTFIITLLKEHHLSLLGAMGPC